MKNVINTLSQMSSLVGKGILPTDEDGNHLYEPSGDQPVLGGHPAYIKMASATPWIIHTLLIVVANYDELLEVAEDAGADVDKYRGLIDPLFEEIEK